MAPGRGRQVNGEHRQVVVVGGGQAGLAAGYFLHRAGLDFVILDVEPAPGGAWRHAWDSLHLFSPGQWSSLPGWPMPPVEDTYPSRDQVISYLTTYEQRYALPVRRPVHVERIVHAADHLRLITDAGTWTASAVVSATGNWRHPFIPVYAGVEHFRGRQIHSAIYRSASEFAGLDVLIVGGGNSGAQITAEVSRVARTHWVTLTPPTFLPDDVDGRVLFERATARWKAEQEGREAYVPAGGLGDIVMLAPVRNARARGALSTDRPFSRFVEHGVIWEDGSRSSVDAVIWCTGFRANLAHLAALGIVEADGRVIVKGGHAVKEQRLWLLGYGDWTGIASATLVGVTRTARTAIQEISEYLAQAG
jgi:putative flavoprotein involved in K+ transport